MVPWLQARTRWQIVSAEILLERLTFQQVRSLWPLLARWDTPGATLAAETELREIGTWIGRRERAERIAELAGRLACAPEQLDDDEGIRAIPGLNDSIADLAVLAVPNRSEDSSEEPVLPGRGVLRAVARFTGEGVDRRNRLTDGRLGVARMIGYGSNARDAHLGLIELAAAVCRPAEPACVNCPLAELCADPAASAQREPLLF